MIGIKSLIHYGIYLPSYSSIGLTIKYKGKCINLSEEAEQMTIAFLKKEGTPYLEDSVFVKNFLSDFSKELSLSEEVKLEDFDFSEVRKYLANVKEKTEAMSKEEKKLARELKQKLRNKLKEKYGYAKVDGERIEIQNWICEPASIFLSKGKNPLRGHWKRAIRREEVTLNLSERPKDLEEGWKEIVWKSDCMWIASWRSPLDNKMKYVWFSPSSEIRQEKEKMKYELASKLEDEIDKLKRFIERELESKNLERRKLATAVYLIMSLGLRVGDEVIAGERGTVGCTTLKKENISIKDNHLHLSFIGKDYVKWERELTIPDKVSKNLLHLIREAEEDYIFKGIDSSKISSFLREVIPGLSAKVFRTCIAGSVWDNYTKESLKVITSVTPLYIKKYLFKLANLEVAKKLNHKRALPKNYEERLEEKRERLEKERAKLASMKEVKRKKYFTQLKKTEKIAVDYELFKETAEWNLNTSLTSYISPLKVLEYCKEANLELKEVYPKSLLKKFSWILEE